MPIVKSSGKKIKVENGNLRFYKNFDTATKCDFLSAQTVLSVPAVQPDCGGFAKIINETGAGLLYSENSPDALADALAKIITNKNARNIMSDAGVKAALEKYNNIVMARQLTELL